MKYICNCCGKEHEDWPAIVYSYPSHYQDLTDEELTHSELTSDFCIINYPEQTDRFIRGVLIQKLINDCQTLEYGIWVSLSEINFQEYSENFNNENFEAQYFAWFSNHLPDYIDEFTLNIPTKVIVNNKIGRPTIIPDSNFNHLFVEDFNCGITKESAQKRIEKMFT